MAMTMKAEGLDEVSRLLAQLGQEAEHVAAESLFEGAKIVADSMSASIKSIRAEPQQKKNKAPEKTPARYPTPEEKAALTGKIGIAKFDKNGSEVDTIIGFSNAGYADVNGRSKPVAEIARSINSGTSFMHKQPFIRKAISKSKEAAADAIARKAEEKFKEIIGK